MPLKIFCLFDIRLSWDTQIFYFIVVKIYDFFKSQMVITCKQKCYIIKRGTDIWDFSKGKNHHDLVINNI